jgi:putative DNA primase/helicase
MRVSPEDWADENLEDVPIGDDPSGSNGSDPDDRSWPAPTPLPDGLLKVEPFNLDFLPATIRPWAADISDRMQCPPDFVGTGATVALGSVIGRKIGIRPQRHTDWLEVPNLWACVVGQPGTLKSPALQQALAPLRNLEEKTAKANEAEAQLHVLEQEAFKLRKEAASQKARQALKDGGTDVSAMLAITAPEAPRPRRYISVDTTYEALGVILADNPNGVLAFRDELVSLLRTLDREEYASARGFYLSAWNGTQGYTFDRIIRGITRIEAACLSMLGSTQPGRLAGYIRRATRGSADDDGLIQRFGLLVWPDQSLEWHDVDRCPSSAARETAWATFGRLDRLTPQDVRAEGDEFEPVPFLRFDDAAQAAFLEWRSGLEKRLRAGELGAALEGHLAKYRKLVPALALIGHLADGGSGPITETALRRALAYARYLETHARRAYAAGSQVEVAAAKAILARIRKADLSASFTAREVHQRDWSGLTDHDQVLAGLNLLIEYDWLAVESQRTNGRPRVVYHVNPMAVSS